MSVSRRILFGYALPAVPLAALTLPLYIVVPTFYTETLGLSLAAVGGVLLAIRIFDAITDPLTGWVADRWRPSVGRRRAMFAVSLPLTALSALMLFWPPEAAGTTYLFIWSGLLSLGYTASILPYSAWGAELAGDYEGRSRVAGFREGFTLVGTLMAIALPFAIGIESASGLHGLAVLGIAVALALPLAGAVTLSLVPEPREYSTGRLKLGAALRQMAGNGPFLRLISAYFLNGLANGIPATLFLYFVSERLGAPEMRGPLLFLYFCAGIAGVPAAVALARRMGKHRAWSSAMILNCAIFACVPFLGTGDVLAFAAICVGTGILLGFDLALPPAIQADVIDVDTAASGEQRTAAYFAAWGLATKLSLAAGVGLVFPLLAYFGFQTGEGARNGEDAISALVAIYVWIPVALKLAAIGLMWSFPLDPVRQGELRQKIEARTA